MNNVDQDWWEYTVVSHDTELTRENLSTMQHNHKLQDLLNRHGCLGYELVAVIPVSIEETERSIYSQLIFKRPTNVDYSGIFPDRQVDD